MFYRKQKCTGVFAPWGFSISDAVREAILIELYFCDFRSEKSTALLFSKSLNQAYSLVRYKWASFVNTYNLKNIITSSCKMKGLSCLTEIACCETSSWSCSLAVSKPVLHTPLLCVQWKTPDDGQRNCPKRVDFCSKNKFEKLVHLVGFIISIYHDARSAERQMHIRGVEYRSTHSWPLH